MNYTVSCSGDVTCPPNFTTTDNTTRNYTFANLTTMANYTFSVVATNSIGSGEAGVVMITTPGEIMTMYYYIHTYVCVYVYKVQNFKFTYIPVHTYISYVLLGFYYCVK